MDGVLAARYDQMARCYKMSMEESVKAGFGWVVRSARLDYKRALCLGDAFTVRTWIDPILKDGVRVRFEIFRKPSPKLCCAGEIHSTWSAPAPVAPSPFRDGSSRITRSDTKNALLQRSHEHQPKRLTGAPNDRHLLLGHAGKLP